MEYNARPNELENKNNVEQCILCQGCFIFVVQRSKT